MVSLCMIDAHCRPTLEEMLCLCGGDVCYMHVFVIGCVHDIDLAHGIVQHCNTATLSRYSRQNTDLPVPLSMTRLQERFFQYGTQCH